MSNLGLTAVEPMSNLSETEVDRLPNHSHSSIIVYSGLNS